MIEMITGGIGIWEHYDFRLDNPQYPAMQSFSPSMGKRTMNLQVYAFVYVSKGIIFEVTFFDDKEDALAHLKSRACKIDIREEDAAVYGGEGLVADIEAYLPVKATKPYLK